MTQFPLLAYVCIRCWAQFDVGIEPPDRKCPFCGKLVVRQTSASDEGSDMAKDHERII